MSMINNAWQRLKRRTVYENPWIKLTHDDVITPAGTEGIYGVVHFKNQAVGVLPIDDEGYTWLVGQSRYALGEYSWEIPEGGVPFGEEPLDGAKRELQEETGLTAKHWELLMQLHTSNSVCNERAYVYLARGLSCGSQALEATEDITLKRVTLEQAVKMAYLGEITDAISVAALLRIALMMDIKV
ncbi:MAG: DNA mismatch repair protein MutT [Alteromonadaceae bacterium]|nr:MAG: DNA mismatch repair protein MutT [Alteromonadaceae bacterium]